MQAFLIPVKECFKFSKINKKSEGKTISDLNNLMKEESRKQGENFAKIRKMQLGSMPLRSNYPMWRGASNWCWRHASRSPWLVNSVRHVQKPNERVARREATPGRSGTSGVDVVGLGQCPAYTAHGGQAVVACAAAADLAICEGTAIEGRARPRADAWMHAVLRPQHQHRRALPFPGMRIGDKLTGFGRFKEVGRVVSFLVAVKFVVVTLRGFQSIFLARRWGLIQL